MSQDGLVILSAPRANHTTTFSPRVPRLELNRPSLLRLDSLHLFPEALGVDLLLLAKPPLFLPNNQPPVSLHVPPLLRDRLTRTPKDTGIPPLAVFQRLITTPSSPHSTKAHILSRSLNRNLIRSKLRTNGASDGRASTMTRNSAHPTLLALSSSLEMEVVGRRVAPISLDSLLPQRASSLLQITSNNLIIINMPRINRSSLTTCVRPNIVVFLLPSSHRTWALLYL